MSPNIKYWFIASLIIFLITGFSYSLVVPPFETPDELYHYAFVRHLAQGNWLPVQSAEETGPWSQEGSQAPLYYLMAGWLTRGIDQNDFDQLNRINDRSNIGDPLYPGNKNRMLYSARSTCFFRCDGPLDLPLRNTNLAMHLGRWISLAMGGLTLWFLYLTGKLAFPTEPTIQIIALLLVATIPQFVFISASVSNDNAINVASAAAVYYLARLLAKQDQAPILFVEWLILGILLGIAALSKLQGLGLWLLAALTGLILAWKRRDWQLPLRAILPVALPALLICGWWYWRNYTLYDDWLGVTHLLDINGRRDSLPDWESLVGELRGLRYSFWGLFGWFNILLPTFIYRILDWVTLIAILGLLIALIRKLTNLRFATKLLIPNDRLIQFLLVVWASLSLALIAYWSSQATGSQGRLLFPGITAFALLLSAGWYCAISLVNRWFPDRVRRYTLFTIPILLLGCSIYALVWLLPNAYAAPKPIADLPTDVIPVDISYRDPTEGSSQFHLSAIDIPTGRYYPGDRIPATLYLSIDEPADDDYQMFIQLLDETGAEIANLTTHPGWGRNPTTLWQPGVIYPDRYQIELTRPIDSFSPLLARIYTGFIKPSTAQSDLLPIDAYNANGEEIVPIVSSVAISPLTRPDIEDLDVIVIGSDFGHAIRLVGFSALNQLNVGANTLMVTLVWDALASPSTDYVAFVHLRNSDGERIAGFDQPPAANRFPTRYWQAGDRVLSEFSLPLPADLAAGQYELWIGLYEVESQGAVLLPVTDAGKGHVEHNQVRVGMIEVSK
ncbi:glycosyltransferase family 39 protein [Chloroflexi bacterium TSY]|nr:glycosyltransferase family 39 protein [Chloroflexi bacterium TSY]